VQLPAQQPFYLPDFIRIYPFVPLENTEIWNTIDEGFVEKLSSLEIIERSAHLFIAAQHYGIPVSRIGLPNSGLTHNPFPENLAQVVIAKALQLSYEYGEREYLLPRKWLTSVNIVKKLIESEMKIDYFG